MDSNIQHSASYKIPQWKVFAVGGATVTEQDGLRFSTFNASDQKYANAQLDDYHGLPRRHFRWRPPLTLKVRARFSHANGHLKGTAGFGFWNDPFAMTGRRLPALPGAIWFFYSSPPSNIALAYDVAGHGWKVAALDATRWQAMLLAPFAPLTVPLMNIRPLYRQLWPAIQNGLAVSEKPLEEHLAMTGWHDYELEWNINSANFRVDGKHVLEASNPPAGPLGFVMWLDNQYAIATPQGRFGWGLLNADGQQQMNVEHFSIIQHDSNEVAGYP